MITTSIQALAEAIVGCTACSARLECRAPVPFEPSASKYVIVGRNPGRTEDAEGRPFVGPGGKLLDEWIERSGMSRADFWITNLIKCYTTNDRPPTDHEINTCVQHHLFRELGVANARIVIPLGKQALHAFLPGVSPSPIQGVWWPKRSYTIFYLHHPGYVLRGGFPKNDWLALADKFRTEVEFLA